MTSSNQAPAARPSAPRQSLTLLQMLAVVASGGLAASLLLKLFV